MDFNHGHGLTLEAGGAFEVAAADGEWHPAEARVQGDQLFLSTGTVNQPRAARYAWRANPAAVLFNRAGLPASPFCVYID